MSGLAATIAAADPARPAGQLLDQGRAWPVEVASALNSVGRVRAIPLTADQGGDMLTVGDIATVERAMRTPQDSIVLVDGRQAVVVAAQMADRGRIAHWTAAVDAVLARLRRGAACRHRGRRGLRQSRYTEERIDTLAANLGLGVLLVALVLVVMMGWRSALLVASALPLTLLMVLAGFYWLGVPLHQISLTGLIIALGLLIDNVIISADSYQRHREQRLSPEAAVRATSRRCSCRSAPRRSPRS